MHTQMAVQIADKYSQLLSLEREWLLLSRHASEPNIFFEAWMLIPAIRYLSKPGEISVVCVRDESGTLRALLPLCKAKTYRGLTVEHLSVWKHIHCFLCTPLVWQGYEQFALQELVDWSQDKTGALLLLQQFHNGGPIKAALNVMAVKNNLKIDALEIHERAILDTTLEGEAYLEQSISAAHRSDLRRRYFKLQQLGSVRTVIESNCDNVDQWIAQFLELEKSGWKGLARTALAFDSRHQAFFKAILHQAAALGAVILAKLEFNGRPIAMKILFKSGDTAFCWKIAYDESFSRYSPGFLLFIEIMKELGGGKSAVRWVDSCAEPNHPLLNRIWRERREICSVALSKQSVSSKMLITALSSGARLKHAIRALHLFGI